MAKLNLVGKICVAAGICGIAAGAYTYTRRQDEQYRQNQKQVEFIVEATNLESDIKKALDAKNELEQKAKESLKKTLECIGITKDEEIDYFHKVMQDDAGCILMKSYVKQGFTEENKASKEGFDNYCKTVYTIMQTPKDLRNKLKELNEKQKANYAEIQRLRSMSPGEFSQYRREKEQNKQ